MSSTTNQQPERRSCRAIFERGPTQTSGPDRPPAVVPRRLRVPRRLALLLVALTVLLPALPACRSQQAYETVSVASLSRDDRLEPKGDVILSVSGAIERSGDGNEVRLDLETLERLGMVQYAIVDPWLDSEVTYAGVLVSAILDALDVKSTAEGVVMTALDDYRVEIPVDSIREWPILLATRRDGQPLRISEGGPSRVIYPIHAFDRATHFELRANWIWNVESFEIR